MTSSQEILLSLCRSYLNGSGVDATVGLEKADWSEVYEVAQQQAVAGVVFEELTRLYNKYHIPTPETELKMEWFGMQHQIVQQNVKVNMALWKLADALSRKHINAVLLKGQGLAFLYGRCLGNGQSEKRQPGDIDIYVGREKYAETLQMMQENGWGGGKMREENLKHCVMSIDGVMVEVHRFAATVPGLNRNFRFQKMMCRSLKDSLEGFFVTKEGEICGDSGVFVKTLPEVENVMFTFTHMFAHLLSGGMSLRQLMDVVVALRYMCSRQKSTEFVNELQQKLKSIGYLRTWQVFGCIMVKHLGVKPEDYPCYSSVYESKAERILEEMFCAAQQREDKREDKDGKRGLGHYLWVCGKYFRVVSIFPSACLYAFSYMIADVSAKHFYRRRGW